MKDVVVYRKRFSTRSAGCTWSSLSTIVSAAFGAFDMGQISSSATSISLSDTPSYRYFYRTIPSDALQTQGIILCKNLIGLK